MPPKASTDDDEGLWTVQQLADYLQISVAHCYRVAQNNGVPKVRIGSSVRFDPKAVKAWVQAKTVKAVS